jgi:hypothetical protein
MNKQIVALCLLSALAIPVEAVRSSDSKEAARGGDSNVVTDRRQQKQDFPLLQEAAAALGRHHTHRQPKQAGGVTTMTMEEVDKADGASDIKFGEKPPKESTVPAAPQTQTKPAQPDAQPTKEEASGSGWITGWFSRGEESDNSELLGTVRWQGRTYTDSGDIATRTFGRIQKDTKAKKGGKKVCDPEGLLRYDPADTASMLSQACEDSLNRLPEHVCKPASPADRTGEEGRLEQFRAFVEAANVNGQAITNRPLLRKKLEEQKMLVLKIAQEELNRAREEVKKIQQCQHDLHGNTTNLTTSRPGTPDSLAHTNDETAFLEYILVKEKSPGEGQESVSC